MSDTDARAVALADLMGRLATGDYAARAEPTDARDELDALAVGLNILAETLELEHEARGRAEALLRDELDAYDRAPAMFCSVVTSDLTIAKCNATLAATLKMAKDDVVGRPVTELFAEGDRGGLRSAIAQMSVDSTPTVGDFHLVTADGSAIPVVISGSVAEADTPAERVRLILRDVSSERSLEAQLRQSQKMDAIGRLASGVAHDFNNILAVIHSAESFLEEALGDGHPAAPDLAMIREAADRATRLTKQLLSFGSDRVVEPRVVDLVAFLRESRDMLERAIGETYPIDWTLHDTTLPVRIDPTSLTQVVLNLLLNARDAMPDGGSVQIAAIPAPSEPKRAWLELRDQGAGMTPDVLERAFEPFFTTKARGEGSGLGLAVCFGIVRQNGGTIELDSQAGAGTTVRISLPMSEAEAEQLPPRTETEEPRGRGERILVVDDAPEVLAVIKRLLSGFGYEVIPAEGGVRALEIAFDEGGIDLLLTVVVMPTVSGPDLAQSLWHHKPRLPVVFASGYTGDRLDASLLNRDGVYFLAKPFRPRQLREIVREALAGATEQSAPPAAAEAEPPDHDAG